MTQFYFEVKPMISIDEFFTAQEKYTALPEHRIQQSPCYHIVGSKIVGTTTVYYCKLHPTRFNVNLSAVEHHCRYSDPEKHKQELLARISQNDHMVKPSRMLESSQSSLTGMVENHQSDLRVDNELIYPKTQSAKQMTTQENITKQNPDDVLNDLETEIDRESVYISLAENEPKKLKFLLERGTETIKKEYKGEEQVKKRFFVLDLGNGSNEVKFLDAGRRLKRSIAEALRKWKGHVIFNVTKIGSGFNTNYSVVKA